MHARRRAERVKQVVRRFGHQVRRRLAHTLGAALARAARELDIDCALGGKRRERRFVHAAEARHLRRVGKRLFARKG